MVTLVHDDCLTALRDMPDNYVDSVVTDPPYELRFMGKEWDDTGVSYDVEVWAEILRVLKPGGHLLAFGAPKTYHRMTCAIEDAGFELRDCLMWCYGTGFPKSHDVSKAIDREAGVERQKRRIQYTSNSMLRMGGQNARPYQDEAVRKGYHEIDGEVPATTDAERWYGWGTALKPAYEPIMLARKPLSERTVASNVLKWGTGGLNIDGCRIGEGGDYTVHHGGSSGTGIYQWNKGEQVDSSTDYYKTEGRFPANLLLDEEAATELDAQSGISQSTPQPRHNKAFKSVAKGAEKANTTHGYADSGGASRFFYVAKASKRERTHGGKVENQHPTVKPLGLMEYLIRLVTPPGGIVLDPFVGSGTTLLAARRGGWSSIGVDMDEDCIKLSEARLRADD